MTPDELRAVDTRPRRRHRPRRARADDRRARDHARHPPRGDARPAREGRPAARRAPSTSSGRRTSSRRSKRQRRSAASPTRARRPSTAPSAGPSRRGRAGEPDDALRRLQARERGNGARLFRGRRRRQRRPPPVRRLRAGPGPGLDRSADAGDGGGRARRGLPHRASAAAASSTTRPTSRESSSTRRAGRASGAVVVNVGGPVVGMRATSCSAIEAAAPEVAGRITFDEAPLPFPEEFLGGSVPGGADAARGRRPRDDRALPRRAPALTAPAAPW